MPAVALPPTSSVSEDDPDPGAAMLDGLKVAVTPDGKPLADRETAELNPSKTWVVTVVVPELPASTVSESGLARVEKLALLPDQGVPPVKSLVKVL